MDRLASGIPVLDRAWTGLRSGGTYVLSGQAQSGQLVGLRMAQSALEQGARCVYVADHAPAELLRQASALQFDLQAAAQAQRFRLLRPPALPDTDDDDDALDQVLKGLVALAKQAAPGLLLVEDFTPFLGFRDPDRLSKSFARLIVAVRVSSAVFVAGVGTPASGRPSNVVTRLRRAAAGTVEVDLAADKTARRILLHPGTDPSAKLASGTWAPAAVPEQAAAPSPLQGARFSGDAAPRATPAPSAPPPAAPPPAAPAADALQDGAPATAFAHFDVPAEVPYGAVPPSDPPSPTPNANASMSFAASAQPTLTVRPINLAAAVYDVNPHLQPADFEFDGGVLLDSADAEMSARALDGTKVTLGAHGIFRRDGVSGDGMAGSEPDDGLTADFTGAPEFDPAPPAPKEARPEPARPPAPMPQFASLVAHTFDQTPRGRFSQELQAAYARYNEKGEPFLALALRMDPSNPFAEAFPLVADAVREAVDERDPIYSEPDRKRMLALLPERTQQATSGIFAAIKAQLQLSGGASDAVFTAISAVAIPNGEPFANARDLVTFAFDAD